MGIGIDIVRLKMKGADILKLLETGSLPLDNLRVELDGDIYRNKLKLKYEDNECRTRYGFYLVTYKNGDLYVTGSEYNIEYRMTIDDILNNTFEYNALTLKQALHSTAKGIRYYKDNDDEWLYCLNIDDVLECLLKRKMDVSTEELLFSPVWEIRN